MLGKHVGAVRMGRLGRILLFGIVSMLACSLLLTATGGTLKASGDGSVVGGTVELTVADAIRLAFEYDVEHEIARLNWDNARIDNLIARASGPVSAYEQLQRDLQERRAENAYVGARNTLVMGVVQQYFDVKQAEHQAEISRRQADIARRELDVVRQMVQIGERHPQDELREQNRLAGAQLSADTAARTYANSHSAFIQRLGMAEDVQLLLVDEPETPAFEYSLDETVAYALDNSFVPWERDVNLRLAEMDLEALRVQDAAPLQLKKAENNWLITQLNASQSGRTFHNNVVSAYYSLADAARRLEAAQVDRELAEAAYAGARRQHEAGLTTDDDWERARLERLNADQSYRDSAATYMRNRLDLLHLIGRHLAPDEPSQGSGAR